MQPNNSLQRTSPRALAGARSLRLAAELGRWAARGDIDTMKKALLLSAILLALGIGLIEFFPSKPESNVIKRPGKPDFVEVDEEDKQMNRAIEKAKESLPEFIAAMEAPSPGMSAIAIKKRFAHA